MKMSSTTSAAWVMALCVSAFAGISGMATTSQARTYENVTEYVDLSRRDSRTVMHILERVGVQHNGSYGAITLETDDTVCSKISVPGFPIRCTVYIHDTHLNMNARDSITLNSILKKYGAPSETLIGATNVFAKGLTCSQSITPGFQKRSCWFEK